MPTSPLLPSPVLTALPLISSSFVSDKVILPLHPRLRTFNFRLFYGHLPVHQRLHRFQVVPSPTCVMCNVFSPGPGILPETLEHLFTVCPVFNNIRNTIERYFRAHYLDTIFTVPTILYKQAPQARTALPANILKIVTYTVISSYTYTIWLNRCLINKGRPITMGEIEKSLRAWVLHHAYATRDAALRRELETVAQLFII